MSHWTEEMKRAQSERAKKHWAEWREKKAKGELLPPVRDSYKHLAQELVEENAKLKQELETQALRERREWLASQHPKVTFEDILVAAEIFMRQNPSWEIVITVRIKPETRAELSAGHGREQS